MQVQVKEQKGHAIILPQGYLNGALGDAIDQTCGNLIAQGKTHILINFSEIETMNTMGVASLVSVLEKVSRRKGIIYFTHLVDTNRQLLDVLNISRAVLIFDTDEKATEHLQQQAAQQPRH